MNAHVKYELEEIERLASAGLGEEASEKLVFITRDLIKTEIERIKRTFIHEVFSFEDEHHLERYIQYHQQAVIRLMDKVAFEASAKSFEAPNNLSIRKVYYEGLEELLRFIERHFARYFDQDAKAPEGYISLAVKMAKGNLKKINKSMRVLGADPLLAEVLLCGIRRIVDENMRNDITYRKVMYANAVQKELFRLIQKANDGQEDINERLRHIIQYLNFNGNKALAYYVQYFSSLVGENDSRHERIDKLSFELKKINQSQVKPCICYHKDHPSLKQLLNEYINEEIEYLKGLQQLNSQGSNQPPDSFLSGFKLQLSTSVAQVAYLVKIFIETKIIENKNLTEVFRFLSRIIVTKRSENISYDSFRSKFYNVEKGTKESVRNILVTMVQYIDRH